MNCNDSFVTYLRENAHNLRNQQLCDSLLFHGIILKHSSFYQNEEQSLSTFESPQKLILPQSFNSNLSSLLLIGLF